MNQSVRIKRFGNFAAKSFRVPQNKGYHALLCLNDDDRSLENFTRPSRPLSDQELNYNNDIIDVERQENDELRVPDTAIDSDRQDKSFSNDNKDQKFETISPQRSRIIEQ